MALTWTDEEKKQRTPTERAKRKVAPLPKLWELLRSRCTDQALEQALLKGLPQATPENADRLRAVDAILRGAEPPTSFERPDIAAVFFRHARNFVSIQAIDLLGAIVGPAKTVDAVARAMAFDTRWQSGATVLVEGDGRAPCGELRNYVLGLDEDGRAEAVAAAEAAWPNATLGAKTTLAYAFFEKEAWGDEVARAFVALPDATAPLDFVWATVRDFDLAVALVRARKSSRSYADLLDRFGERFLKIVLEVFASPRDEHDLRYAARALSQFDDEEVGRAFAAQLGAARAREVAVDWFARHPRRALEILPALAKEKGRVAKFAAEILERAERSAGEESSAGREEASNDELPSILRDPPWMQKKRPTHQRIVVQNVKTPAREDRVDVPPAMRDRLLRPQPHMSAHRALPEMTPELVTEYLADIAAGVRVNSHEYKQHRVPDDVRLRLFNEGAKVYVVGVGGPSEMLARFGKDAILGIARWIREHLADSWDPGTFAEWVDSPSIAVPLARLLRHKRKGALAFHWLRTHVDAALDGLIPTAVGEQTEDRDAAEDALRRLAAKGVDVRAGAKRFAEDVQRAVDAILAWDGRYTCPKKAPKLPPSFRPDAFTRPRLASGKVLPVEAVLRIGEMLAFSPVDPPYAGLVELQDACDERSLGELSWDIARAWVLARHKDKDVWMLHALVHFADDAVVRRTTPGITDPRIVEVLERIGTDAALMELATIAARSSGVSIYYGLATHVESALDRIAALRGVTKDELEESIAPTFDFARPLDFGDRLFEVHVDETLTPYLLVPGSRDRIHAMPPSRKTDDARKVEAAKVHWKDLREDLAVLSRRRIRALERAMLARRRWTLPAFRAAWVDHPLMVHLARGLVWSANGHPFRVVEDRTFADSQDHAITLGDDTEIELVHPLRISPEERAAFRRIFDDYQILEPFLQIGRPTFTIDGVRDRTEIVVAPELDTTSIHQRLVGLGWSCYQSGGRWGFQRTLPSGAVTKVEFDQVKVVEAATIRFVRDLQPITLGEVDPVEYSEAMYDLHPSR